MDHLHPSHIVMVTFRFPHDECIFFSRIEPALSDVFPCRILRLAGVRPVDNRPSCPDYVLKSKVLWVNKK